MEYALNDGLDIKALAKEFKKSGRVQVKNALEENSADALSEVIEKMAIWRLHFLDRNTERVMSAEEVGLLTKRREKELMERLYLQARDGFQYIRYECPTDDIPNAKDPKALVDADVFFRSDDFRDLLRAVSGQKEGEMEGVQARWLNRDKLMADTARATNLPQCKLYFSMDVTRKWRPNWGGVLGFLDDDGEIETSWSPAFNRLNIYAGSSRHSISYVAHLRPPGVSGAAR
jgi:hypothetical protein